MKRFVFSLFFVVVSTANATTPYANLYKQSCDMLYRLNDYFAFMNESNSPELDSFLSDLGECMSSQGSRCRKQFDFNDDGIVNLGDLGPINAFWGADFEEARRQLNCRKSANSRRDYPAYWYKTACSRMDRLDRSYFPSANNTADVTIFLEQLEGCMLSGTSDCLNAFDFSGDRIVNLAELGEINVIYGIDLEAAQEVIFCEVIGKR